MQSDSLSSTFWAINARVNAWLADALPAQGVFLPIKASAAGMAALSAAPANQTLAESVGDYASAAVQKVANVPPDLAQSMGVADTIANAADAVRGTVADTVTGAAAAFSLPVWVKVTIAAALLLGVYELTKGKA